MIKKTGATSVLEVGVGDGTRSEAVLRTLIKSKGDTEIQYIIPHRLLDATELESHIDHYEENWRSAFTFDFDLTGASGLTGRYVKPPVVGQIGGRFTFTSTIEAQT